MKLSETFELNIKQLDKPIVKWLHEIANWTHAVTLTLNPLQTGRVIHPIEIAKRCRLFLSRLNRRIYGRHGVRRKGLKVASAAVFGYGAYEDHPHIHLVLEQPSQITHEEFTQIIHNIASTTKGLAHQHEVKRYFSSGWINYMVDHGFEGWIDSATHTAKCH
jgi:hypothetical protein